MILAAIRDVAIALLAIESIVIGVLLAVLLVQLRRLVRMLREEVAPLLKQASDTATTVQGTVSLVSHTVVNPLVRVSSAAAGVRQAARSFLGIKRRAKGG